MKNAFSQIEVQLKRRYDLIPNLVELVKGTMSHEKETLQAVIEAKECTPFIRTRLMNGIVNCVKRDKAITTEEHEIVKAIAEVRYPVWK